MRGENEELEKSSELDLCDQLTDGDNPGLGKNPSILPPALLKTILDVAKRIGVVLPFLPVALTGCIKPYVQKNPDLMGDQQGIADTCLKPASERLPEICGYMDDFAPWINLSVKLPGVNVIEQVMLKIKARRGKIETMKKAIEREKNRQKLERLMKARSWRGEFLKSMHYGLVGGGIVENF